MLDFTDLVVVKLQDVILQKDKTIETQSQHISALKAEVATLKKLIFGQKTERFIGNEIAPDQMGLFTEVSEEIIAEAPKEEINYQRKKAKPHPGRQVIPDHIPVKVIVIEPEHETTGMKCIGKEITKTLDYTPAKLICIQYERPKYVNSDETSESIVIATLPSRPIDKAIAEAGLLAHFWISKFIDHLPFYRQIAIFKRDHKMYIAPSTMNGWFVKCCSLMEPLYHLLRHKILQGGYLQVDESPIKVLESEKKGKSHQGYMWVYHSVTDGLVLFEYSKGRSTSSPKKLLDGFTGQLQCDGYVAYDVLGKDPGITLIGCWAHLRRYFHEALDTDKKRAEHALSIIQKIYFIDRQIKEKKIEGARSALINPLMAELKEWADDNANHVLPKSAIGKALTYLVKQWLKLKNVTLKDYIKLDNNLIENKIRPLALGRKNYLFAGNHGSAQRIAMMYSFFATCKIHNVNPQEWMTDVLRRLPDQNIQDLEILLPHKWQNDNTPDTV